MPLLKSAAKKMRQDRVRTARNRLKRESLHDAVKSVEKAAKAGSGEIVALLQKAYKVIDKSVKTHIIHANNGARKKSRLAKLASKTTKK